MFQGLLRGQRRTTLASHGGGQCPSLTLTNGLWSLWETTQNKEGEQGTLHTAGRGEGESRGQEGAPRHGRLASGVEALTAGS